MAKLYYFISEYLWVFGVLFFIILSLSGIRKREKHEKEAKKKWADAVDKKMDEPMTLHPEIRRRCDRMQSGYESQLACNHYA